MPWVKLDDDFFDHIKVIRAGRDARDLWLAAVLYSSKSLSDGFVPSDILDYLAGKAGVSNAPDLAHRLVDVNLWEEAEGGWLIHDYHEYNPAAEKVKADRNAARERMAKVRENGHAQIPDVPPLYRSRSPEVQANNERSSPEVPPTPYPVPVPDPVPGPGPGEFVAPTAAAAARNATNGTPKRKQREPTEHDRYWEAFVAAIGTRPESRPELAKWGTGIKAIRDAGVTLEEIPAIVRNYRARCPSMPCNPAAIASHLSDYQGEQKPTSNGSRAVDRSELAGGVDYIALYDAKRKREQEERDARAHSIASR